MNVKKKCGVMRNDSVAGNKKTLPYLPFFFFSLFVKTGLCVGRSTDKRGYRLY